MNSKNSRKKDLRKFRKLHRKTSRIMNGGDFQLIEKDIAMSLNTTVIKEKKK